MKRRALNVVFFLACGAVLNIAVAWCFAVWTKIDRSPPYVVANDVERSLWKQRTPATIAGIPALATRSTSSGFIARHVLAGRPPHSTLLADGDETGRVTGMSFENHTNNPSQALDACIAVSAGWPMQSLQGKRWHTGVTFNWPMEVGLAIEQTPGTAAISDFAIPLQIKRSARTQHRMLPLEPMWPGFAIDTIFYAVIVWMMFAMPFTIRRWRRIKRGQCAWCGYSLRGSGGGSDTCPECGAPCPLIGGPVEDLNVNTTEP